MNKEELKQEQYDQDVLEDAMRSIELSQQIEFDLDDERKEIDEEFDF